MISRTTHTGYAIGVHILCALENREVRVTVDLEAMELVVHPVALLTPEESEEIHRHYDHVLLAALVDADSGVRARRRAFADRTTSNRLVPDAPYQPGLCFSCGTDSPPHGARPTRCWRCRVAWQVALDDASPLA